MYAFSLTWLIIALVPALSLLAQHSGDCVRVSVPDSGPGKSTSPEQQQPFLDLLAPDFTKHWKCYNSDPDVPLASVWKMSVDDKEKSLVLVCSGHPKGFLYTSTSYSNFELMLDWRFPSDANGNSGVLVYTQNESRIWPTAMQIQFHQPKAGSIFPSGEAKSDISVEADLARPVNTWNECRIVSLDGRLSVEINGRKAGDVTGVMPATGSIALQSEGAEVHFRRVRIRPL